MFYLKKVPKLSFQLPEYIFLNVFCVFHFSHSWTKISKFLDSVDRSLSLFAAWEQKWVFFLSLNFPPKAAHFKNLFIVSVAKFPSRGEDKALETWTSKWLALSCGYPIIFSPYLALNSAFATQMARLALLLFFSLWIFPNSYAAACYQPTSVSLRGLFWCSIKWATAPILLSFLV